MLDIKKLDKLQLKNLLKKLQILNYLIKSLWNRWKREFERINYWVNFYKVEYFEVSKDTLFFIEKQAVESFKKLFNVQVWIQDIQFTKNQDLKWWMRVYYNDNMFDLSYNKFENLLK